MREGAKELVVGWALGCRLRASTALPPPPFASPQQSGGPRTVWLSTFESAAAALCCFQMQVCLGHSFSFSEWLGNTVFWWTLGGEKEFLKTLGLCYALRGYPTTPDEALVRDRNMGKVLLGLWWASEPLTMSAFKLWHNLNRFVKSGHYCMLCLSAYIRIFPVSLHCQVF